MGFYINPKKQTKENWLCEHGILLEKKPVWEEVPKSKFLVCWINNVMFTTAGVCYSKAEFDAFAHEDGRLKRWFLVAKADPIIDVSTPGLSEFI
jgi:hypothetical protein